MSAIHDINMEEAENMMADVVHIQRTLRIETIEAYERYKFEAVSGMEKFGGDFVRALASALARADIKNSVKIIRAFHSEVDEHAMLYKIWLAKHKATEGKTE